MDVGFSNKESEILYIKLHGGESECEDLRKIVDAVSEAYTNEVVFKERQCQLLIRDAKTKAAEELRKRIESLIDVREGISGSPPSSSHRETVQEEIAVLEIVWRNLLASIERENLRAQGPGRIRQLQNASVESDDNPEAGSSHESDD